MMKSSAPAGTYIFRPSDSNGSGNLTLCVLEEKENGDRTYKKYRVRVERGGGLSPIPKELQFRFLGGIFIQIDSQFINLRDRSTSSREIELENCLRDHSVTRDGGRVRDAGWPRREEQKTFEFGGKLLGMGSEAKLEPWSSEQHL